MGKSALSKELRKKKWRNKEEVDLQAHQIEELPAAVGGLKCKRCQK